MYRNVGAAGRAHRSASRSLRRFHAKANVTVGYGKKPSPFRRSEPPAQVIEWPITVTLGPDPDLPGALKTVTLRDRQHADSLGFTWVGRPPSEGR